jgi:hypothetical protein
MERNMRETQQGAETRPIRHKSEAPLPPKKEENSWETEDERMIFNMA